MSLPQDAIFVQGDRIELQYQLFLDKKNNVYWNLTDNEIRFELYSPTPIYKATANVTGGSDDQILIVDAAKGIFLVSILAEESRTLKVGDYNFTIQVTTADSKKYTVLRSSLRIVDDSITWDAEPTVSGA